MRNRAATPHDMLFEGRVVTAPFAVSQAPGVPRGFRPARSCVGQAPLGETGAAAFILLFEQRRARFAKLR